jgi:hypothetical protein
MRRTPGTALFVGYRENEHETQIRARNAQQIPVSVLVWKLKP